MKLYKDVNTAQILSRVNLYVNTFKYKFWHKFTFVSIVAELVNISLPPCMNVYLYVFA